MEGHLTLISKDGQKYLIAENLAPIYGARGRIEGVVLVFRDVTDRVHMEEQIRQVQKMEAIGQLAGGIAHDFNNMLAGILGFAELIHRHVRDNDKLQNYCTQVINTAERAREMTEKLLSFARLGQPKSTPVDLHTCITSAGEILSHSLEHAMELHTMLQAEHSMVAGDPAMLENLVINLAINARDAMPDGGVFEVSTENIWLGQDACDASSFDLAPGEYVLLRTRDTGTGMDQVTLTRVFEPFFTTKNTGKGTGLGLSAVYGTVLAHHGSIVASSEPGRGTEFQVCFPVCGGSTVEQDEVEEVPSAASLAGCTVLVVDDEPVIRAMAVPLFEELGISVITAADGAEAVEIYSAHQESIDAVLLDVIMPEMGGREALERLLKIDSRARVIMASGLMSSDRATDLSRVGAAGVVTKPYRRAEILRVLAKTLTVDGAS